MSSTSSISSLSSSSNKIPGTPLRVGDPAPDFTLLDQAGRGMRLAALRGKNVVLFFYPLAGYPPCISEVCGFRDGSSLIPYDAQVIGISKDKVNRLRKFAEKHEIRFPLLSDAKGQVIDLYAVKGLFGFAKRRTFLINKTGSIAMIFEDVNAKTHAKDVLAALKIVG